MKVTIKMNASDLSDIMQGKRTNMKYQQHPDYHEIRDRIEQSKRKMTVYVSNDTDEVWTLHLLRATVDVASLYKVSDNEARRMLRESDIDHPVKMSNGVEYWTE